MSHNEHIPPRPQVMQYVSVPDWDSAINGI